MHIHLGLIFLLGIAFVMLWFFGITPVIACSPPPPPPWYTEVITINPNHSLPNIQFQSITKFESGIGEVGYLQITNSTRTALKLVQYVSSPATPTATPSAIRIAPILELDEALPMIHLGVREIAEFVPSIRSQRSGYYGEGKRPQNPPIPPLQSSELKFEYAGQIHFVPFQISYILNPGYSEIEKNWGCPSPSPLAILADSGIFTALFSIVFLVGGVMVIAKVVTNIENRT